MRKVWLTAYEPEVQAALLQTGHHNLLAAAAGGLVFMPLVTLVAWGHAPGHGLALWLGLSLLSNLAAWVIWAAFRQPVAALKAREPAAVEPAVVRRWMWAHLAVMSAMGAATGAFGALYLPGEGMHNLFVAAAFQGAVAYSAAGNSSHDLPAFLLSLLVAGLWMTGFIPAGFGPHAGQMVGLCWLYIGTLTWVAWQAHEAILRTIGLQISNQRLAAQHEQAAALAQQANRGKSEFLAAASHDLRQPVHALVLLIEALRQQRRRPLPDAPAREDELIHSIDQAGQAIGHLFNDLMELSRLESGHQPVMPTPVHLAALLQQVQARHAAEAAHKGLVLRLRISRAAQAAWLHTDRVMLERCVLNLLSNALRYTDHGGVLLALRARPGGALQLAVIDSGVGMAEADQQRIFDPYVQLGNAERDRSKGLGLGLAIVRQCAQRLGLLLGVRSAPGRGSCFTLTLPASLRLAEPHAGLPAAGSTHPPAWNLDGRRVLLVDDDAMVREAVGSLLRAWGVDLRLATCADDPALTALRGDASAAAWVPELVLCDHRLPGREQGIALLGRLQEQWPGCAALLQTGEPRERVEDEAEAAGFAVLYKPVSPGLLRETLSAVLPARR